MVDVFVEVISLKSCAAKTSCAKNFKFISLTLSVNLSISCQVYFCRIEIKHLNFTSI